MVEANPVTSPEQRRSLEEAIVDTVREPLLVLDDALRVVVASRSFYRAFAPVRTGLGTSIVEALTRQLGGRVTTSAASPGTIVSITVPRAS